MNNIQYYIKYKNMYLYMLHTDSGSASNNFISDIGFSISKPEHYHAYNYDNATSIIDKLTDLGYLLDYFYLEEVDDED